MKKIILVLMLLLTYQLASADILGVKRVPIKACHPICQKNADMISDLRYKRQVQKEQLKKWKQLYSRLSVDLSSPRTQRAKKRISQLENEITVTERLLNSYRKTLAACEKKHCQPGINNANGIGSLRQFITSDTDICKSCQDIDKQIEQMIKKIKEIDKKIYDKSVERDVAEASGQPTETITKEYENLQSEFGEAFMDRIKLQNIQSKCEKECYKSEDGHSMLLPGNTDQSYAYVGAGTGLFKAITPNYARGNENESHSEYNDNYGYENSDSNFQMLVFGFNKQFKRVSLGAEIFTETHTLQMYNKTLAGNQITQLGIRNSFGLAVIPGFMVVPQVTVIGKLGVSKGIFKVYTQKNGNFSKDLTGTLLGAGAQLNLTEKLKLRFAYNYTKYSNVERLSIATSGMTEVFRPKAKWYEATFLYQIG